MKRHHLFAVALISTLLFSVALWVEFRTDASDFFFRGDSAETALVASAIQSGALSRRYILLVESKDQDSDFTAFGQSLEARLKEVTGVERVWSMAKDRQALEQLMADYLPYRMQLFSLNPAHDIPQIFQQEALDQRAKALKEVLLSPDGAWLQPLILQDPLMLIGDWILKLGMPKRQAAPNFAGLIIETKLSGLDAQAQQPIYMDVLKTFEAVNLVYEQDFSLRLTGVPIFAMAIQQQVAQDMKYISLISILLMLLLFIAVFRSVRGLIWLAFILLCTVASATLITSLVFGYIHALTMAIGATLIGVCVDYPIHAMVHAAGKKDAWQSTKRIWPSLWLGGLTTMVGYIALSFTNHPGLQQLAVFAGVGIAVALLLTRYLLPYFMGGHVYKMKVSLALKGCLMIVQRNRWHKQLVVVGIAALLLAAGLPNLVWTDDMQKLSPSLALLKAEDAAIRRQMSSIEAGRFILVQGNSFEQALQRNEQVFAKLQTLKQAGFLDTFHSLYPWLASEKLQQDNIQTFADNLTDKHQQMWQQALRQQGLSVARLGHWADIEKGVLVKTTLASWGHDNSIAAQYVAQGEQVLMMTWLGPHDVERISVLLEGLEGVRYVSQSGIVNKLAADYRSQTINMLWFGAMAIICLLLLRFRNMLTAIIILFPAIVSVGVVMAVWGILGAEMGVLHLIGLLLSVAICVDYAIFFYENRAANQAMTLQAMTVSALTTIAAFLSLGFAENPALQAMAWTVVPGVLMGFLLCPLLVCQQQHKGLKKGANGNTLGG